MMLFGRDKGDTEDKESGCQLVAVLPQQHKSILTGSLLVFGLLKIASQEVCLLALIGRPEQPLQR